MKIITINTWKNEGDYLQRLQLLTAEIQKYQPEIVLLQESFKSDNRRFDTTDTLTKQLDYKMVEAPGRHKTRLHEGKPLLGSSNLAILSKIPIARSGKFFLPTSARDPDRQVLWCAFNSSGKNWLVVNCHLTHIQKAFRLRVAQLKKVLSLTTWLPYDLNILGGDFNFDETSREYKFMRNHTEFIDAYRLKNTDAGFTLASQSKRVDYFFFRSVHSLPVDISCKIIFDQAQNGIYASDHFGLLLNLSL